MTPHSPDWVTWVKKRAPLGLNQGDMGYISQPTG